MSLQHIDDLRSGFASSFRSAQSSVSKISPAQLSLALIIFGVILRVWLYLDNSPFWTDEAQLALNIRDRSFWGLTHHLDYCQAAPLGFLWLEKLAFNTLGSREFSLRLVP